jgi:hypothetical protein
MSSNGEETSSPGETATRLDVHHGVGPLNFESMRGGDDCVIRAEASPGATPIAAEMEQRDPWVLSRPARLFWAALVGRQRMVADGRIRALAVVAPSFELFSASSGAAADCPP